MAGRPLGTVNGVGNDGVVGRLGVGRRMASWSGLLKRSLDPTRYLHSRTNKHSPQSQIDLQNG